MKKWSICLVIMVLITRLASCGTAINEGEKKTVENNKMKIKIGNTTLTATLEDNSSVEALKDLLREAPLTIDFSQYGGFEQVGNIGTSLPVNNTQITTSAGDIVLYGGNQMVMFYGSNSWSYTRLGVIDNLSKQELTDILGTSSVTATFSLE